ncbi:MAG: superoxide dismutase family protein [Pseudomonadota bacterium]
MIFKPLKSAAITLAVCGVAVATGPQPASAQSDTKSLTAEIITTDGRTVGTVTATGMASGVLHLIVDATDLPPGKHGLHIHETGACETNGAFKSAGGHYVGTGKATHGVGHENGPHAGDFPNVYVSEKGVLKTEHFNDRLTINGEESPLQDRDGSALIIHSGTDDYTSQPSGDAGNRIACAVLAAPKAQ